MQTWERMLSWIQFFDEIRPSEQTDSKSNSENSERLITGFNVLQKLSHIHGLNDLDQQTIKMLYQTKFFDFELDLLIKHQLNNESSKNIEDKLIDTASIVHETTKKHHINFALRTKSGSLPVEEINSLITTYHSLKSLNSINKDNYFKILKEGFSSYEETLRLKAEYKIEKLYEEAKKHTENDRISTANDIADQIKNARDSVISSSKDEISAFKSEVGASLVVKDANELWSEKYNSHRKIFYSTGILFSIIVATFITLPICYWPSISKEIMALEPLFQGHILGAITLLLIPVLGVAWILRLLSRFTIQNMILADDAQMRKVMAQTYVKLVSAKAIEDPQDRAIILTALFRPLPGAQGEDISPPSITDVLKTGK